MKLSFSILLLTFLSFGVLGQERNSKKLLKIYEFGAFFSPGTECEIKIKKSFGFKTVSGTCVITSRKIRHNDMVLKKLEKRNGKNWKDEYIRLIGECEEEEYD